MYKVTWLLCLRSVCECVNPVFLAIGDPYLDSEDMWDNEDTFLFLRHKMKCMFEA